MATGVEVAGIVLGSLPLVIEALKAYNNGRREAQTIFQTRYHDHVKSELVTDLYWELWFLGRLLKKLIGDVPGLTDDERRNLLSCADDHQWHREARVVRLLMHYLKDDFALFDWCLGEVYLSIKKLFEDEVTASISSSTDASKIQQQVQQYTEDARARLTKSRFRERWHLFRRKDKLKHEIARVALWRGRLDFVVDGAQQQVIPSGAPQHLINTAKGRPSPLLPRLSKSLYDVLSRKWRCAGTCPATHQASICLKTDGGLHKDSDPNEVEYNLLLSMPHHAPNAAEQWQEINILVRCLANKNAKAKAHQQARVWPLSSICEAVTDHRPPGYLSLLAEHFERGGDIEINRAANADTSVLNFKPKSSPVSLGHSLSELQRLPGLTVKRTLALVLAYSLMTLGGTAWTEGKWTKEHIYFFCDRTQQLCPSQPFISSSMEQQQLDTAVLGLNVLHPLPIVLSLGVLLLEIEIGKPIEWFHQPDDLENGTVTSNTHLMAARREAGKLDDQNSTRKYCEALQACLSSRWGKRGVPATIEDPIIREQMYKEVVSRLEAEVDGLNIPQMQLASPTLSVSTLVISVPIPPAGDTTSIPTK
ncbi:hypothetical protein LTR70_003881 [Exophiala xenobiotica]|uniref:DUF7580 domain-containing protein n=1 Tax=Lithohypha guttulata TaxID=1690604 RepID=A0ABR0KEW5_9EURO|nr:hypothetical protein LTR24_003429 [Lithohypha guttulata]KAK5322200.1 hypothetical protein LTR70_003881 [Exophiala xenobiotica]